MIQATPPQGSYHERLKRVQALARQDSAAAIQELTAALGDDHETIRWAAASALRRMGGAEVVGVLRAFVEQTENAAAREEAEKLLQFLS